jgi:hypothetical protein
MTEMWCGIAGFEDSYEISTLGRVRSLDRVRRRGTGTNSRHGQILKAAHTESGHLTVSLCSPGKQMKRLVHRLMLEAFVGPCPPGLEACHYNDDPADNRLENLRWGTRTENILDAVRNGTHHNASKTHCKRGHEFTPENTAPNGDNGRACRKCSNHSRREWHRRQERPKRPPRIPKTHCKHGHEFTPENTYVRVDSDGTHRRCIECSRERTRRYRKVGRTEWAKKL